MLLDYLCSFYILLIYWLRLYRRFDRDVRNHAGWFLNNHPTFSQEFQRLVHSDRKYFPFSLKQVTTHSEISKLFILLVSCSTVRTAVNAMSVMYSGASTVSAMHRSVYDCFHHVVLRTAGMSICNAPQVQLNMVNRHTDKMSPVDQKLGVENHPGIHDSAAPLAGIIMRGLGAVQGEEAIRRMEGVETQKNSNASPYSMPSLSLNRAAPQ
jgi:hypothetical protein